VSLLKVDSEVFSEDLSLQEDENKIQEGSNIFGDEVKLA
jgi:hypothetical protein